MRFFRKFKYLLTFILVVVLCIVGVIYKDRLIKDSNTKVIMDDVKIKNDVDGFDTIKVDIKGAVNNPGVYEVGEATIINDQTTPNMIQRINGIFERKPLISKEI